MAEGVPGAADIGGVQAEATEQARERVAGAGRDAVIHEFMGHDGGLLVIGSVEVVCDHGVGAVLSISASCGG